MFTADSAVRVLGSAAFENYSARSQRQAPSEELMTGRMSITANGVARHTQTDVLADGRRITITGERVSPAVIRCGDPADAK